MKIRTGKTYGWLPTRENGMTNEELITQARELCEGNLTYWTKTELWSLMGGKDEQINSWTTHLAEMDELIKTVESMDGKGIFYPIYFEELVTKAKRLLGVSEG